MRQRKNKKTKQGWRRGMRRRSDGVKDVVKAASSSLSSVLNERPWKRQRSCAVLGNRSLLGIGQEMSAGKSGDLGANACLPLTSFVSLCLCAKVGKFGQMLSVMTSSSKSP